MTFADLTGAATRGFASSQGIVKPNAFRDFVKLMVADWQQKRQFKQEFTGKLELEKAKTKMEQESPLYQAQTKAYQALGEQRTAGMIDEEIKSDAWKKYQSGDKNPEVLKALGMWVSPMEAIIAGNLGFNVPPPSQSTPNPLPIQTSKNMPPKPKYDPNTQKVMYSPSQNKWYVLPK